MTNKSFYNSPLQLFVSLRLNASSTAFEQSAERLGIFIGFTLLYLATLSQNLSITHDSIEYLDAITNADPKFHANHLLYEHFGVLISQIGSPWFNAQQSLGIAGAIAGGFVTQTIYSMLRDNFKVSAYTSLCAIGIIGFSYGIWYYSTAVEIYIFQLALLMLCFKFLLSQKASYSTFATCALIHSSAVLLHESSVLFGAVPLVAICYLPHRSKAEKFRILIVYVALCALIVGGSYLLAAHSLGKLTSIEQFINWVAGNGSQEEWSGFSLHSILLAVVGSARALISFSFLLSIPEMQGALTSLFPANNLTDETFLVRNLQPFFAISLAVAVIVLSGILMLLAMISVSRLIKAGPSCQLLLVFSWLIPTTLFFIAFNPSNVDFWIPVFALGIVLMAVGAAHRSTVYNSLFATAAVLVFISNFIGVILPATDSSNDYNRQLIDHYANTLSQEDVLVIADDWPIAYHLDYYDRFEYFNVAERFASGKSVSDTANELLSLVENKGNIFVHEDLFRLPSHSLIEWGEHYTTYLKALSQNFCNGSSKNSDGQFPDVVKVSCLLVPLL